MTDKISGNYTVKQGDSFWKISKETGISVENLQKWNNIDSKKLQIGQQLSLSAPQNNDTEGGYTVKAGDSFWKISKETGISVENLQKWNANINPKKLQIGQKLVLSAPQEKQNEYTADRISSQPQVQKQKAADIKSKSNSTKNKSTVDNGILTQDKYETNLPQEVKNVKAAIKKAEGKVSQTYIAPEGNATIAYGHQLLNKPKFLADIENLKIAPKAKNKKLQEALKKPENTAALKEAIQNDLAEAIKLTGIKNIPTTIGKDLKLTDAQMELLLNSDVKKAEDTMHKRIGKEDLAKRTPEQKQVALDMFYNAGKNLKAPNFIKYFKEGDIENAQAEIDFFTTKNKKGERTYQLGLIRRCYSRMLLLNDNKLTETSKQKLLEAYNQYNGQKGKPEANSFAEIEATLKAA